VKKIKIKSSHVGTIGGISDIYIASYAPAELCGIADPFRVLTQAIQLEFPALRATYHGLFKTGGEALHKALEHMELDPAVSGDVLVIGAEKMMHLEPAQASGILAARESAHDRSYGATLPALGGLVTRYYMKTRGVPESALHRVAVKNHANAADNDRAQFRQRLAIEDVASSPLVCDPLRRLHCAPTSDGAAALVLGNGDGEVWVRGWGKGLDTSLFQDRSDIGRFVATKEAARQSLENARIRIEDIDVVEIHDAFASFELINLEEIGFYDLGSSWRALAAGDLDIGGKIAVNPSGGMKALGHPIGAAGLTGAAEIHDQLTGRAGRRQQPGARTGMVQSVGGVSMESYVFLFDTT
jgi:acetyl-CoA acetyltransferase